MRVSGFRAFRVQGVGSRFLGLIGLRVLGFRFLGLLGFRVLGFRVLGFRVLGLLGLGDHIFEDMLYTHAVPRPREGSQQ